MLALRTWFTAPHRNGAAGKHSMSMNADTLRVGCRASCRPSPALVRLHRAKPTASPATPPSGSPYDTGKPPPTDGPRADGLAGKEEAKAAAIMEHTRLRNQLHQMSAGGQSLTHVTASYVVKSAEKFPRPRPLERCQPVTRQELRPGAVHAGRVLRGRLVVDPLVTNAMHTLLEDENGDIVRLFIYNMMPTDLPKGVKPFEMAARLLPSGRHVAIIEPFYKPMIDMSMGVRVDNPAEVVLLDEPPTPASGAAQRTRKGGE